MERSLTPVILVNHKFLALSEPFSVETTALDNIHDLKRKVKEKRRIDLSRNDISFLARINVDDEDTIERLADQVKLVDLEPSVGVTLLVQRLVVTQECRITSDVDQEDRSFVALITSEVDQEYAHCFLRAETEGTVTEADIPSNEIKNARDANVEPPVFVKAYEEILSRKRKLAHNVWRFLISSYFRLMNKGGQMRPLAELLFDKTIADEYFCLMEESESHPFVNRLEVNHLIHISSVNAMEWDTLTMERNRPFKECDAYWLLFYAFANHCSSLPSTDGKAPLVVKRGYESWPFMLVIQVGKKYYSYRPKSDFLLIKHDLPRLAVEVNSYAGDKAPADHHRLMLQGASTVRFANTSLDTFKKEKNFVFVAIFINSAGLVTRKLLFQNQNVDSQKVYWKSRTFNLVDTRARIRFALELYNFSSALHARSEEGDTETQVDKFANRVRQFKTENDLSAFTRSTKRAASKDGGNRSGSNSRQKGNYGTAVRQLEASGYDVVPNVFETDGGTWELISKPPPHLRIVRRRSDPNKTELIAKHVRKGSKEVAIHEYLHSRQPQSPHVIPLIDAIPSTTKEWLILPKLQSIHNQRFMDSASVTGRVRLGWGLVQGLAFLHEHKIAHRDIKPDNLVCDDEFCLRIIDFDLAVEVEDENTEIDEYCGTEHWTAPEMGEEDEPTPMHSPIKADRWSCGRVILRHIMVGMVGNGDHRLSKLANQLMAKDPQERPSLVEWRKFFAPPSSNGAMVLKDRSRRRDMVEVDRENVKPPDAKKPRLEQSEQPELYGSLASRPMGEDF